MTEAGYINDLMERLALSHPEVSFKFINNEPEPGCIPRAIHNLKDIIYGIYGREIAANLVEVHAGGSLWNADGLYRKAHHFQGKPKL